MQPTLSHNGACENLKPNLSILTIAAVTLVLGACAQGAGSPNWSLTDRKPVALGGSGASNQTAAPDGPRYDYRGGRDPVTGRAAVLGSNGAVAEPSDTDGSASGGTPRSVVVQKGDTLHGLSLTYHVSVKALMTANNLKSETIVAGKALVIP